MSSVLRYAAKAVKTPAGRKSKATPDQQFLVSLDYEPYCFQPSDIEALVSSGFMKVSGSLYIAKTKADLDSALTTLDNLNDYYFDVDEYSAVDLGKTIRIGLAFGDNDVITMRLVKRTGNLTSGGGPNHFPNVCYVVTGNKLSYRFNHALYCGIVGTTPNNRSRKPFLNNGDYNPAVISSETLESIFANTLKVSASLYLARNAAELRNVMSALSNTNNYTEIPNNEESSIEMGKSVRVGIVGGENDLLVFRLVKRTGNVRSSGAPNKVPNVGYVCIASKVNQAPFSGASEPRITGSTPNALEVKPQSLLNGGRRPTIFSEATLLSAFANCLNVSGSLYLANDASQLRSVCSALNNATGRDTLAGNASTSVDFGKTIRLGLVGAESDLITFASTKGASNFGNNGPNTATTDLTTGYVVVASKLSQTYNNALEVNVLGSAPRDS